jgi:mRNA deadenylase 3'-5' endonuclease subunit Ccr4
MQDCEKAIKEIEKELKKEAEDEAEDEAMKKYERCNKQCFEPDLSKFKLGYVA